MLVPFITTVLQFIGSFAYILGLVMPAVIETIFYWDIGLGKKDWKLYKNIIIVVLGISAFVFGTIQSVADVIHDLKISY